MLISNSCRISWVFYYVIFKASDIPHISPSNIILFEPRAILRSSHSSLILSFFWTTSTLILACSSLDISHQSFRWAIFFHASKIDLFLSYISSFPENLKLGIDQISLVHSVGSVIKLTETYKARRLLYVLIYWLLVHKKFCFGWSSGCAFSSAIYKVMERISLVDIESERLKRV